MGQLWGQHHQVQEQRSQRLLAAVEPAPAKTKKAQDHILKEAAKRQEILINKL